MNERILPSPALQTLFISRELSTCPLLSEMITLGRTLKDLGLTETATSVISVDYGKRLLINAKYVDVKKMTQQDVVEIVDYDPLKNIMMVIGPKDPNTETPVHWIIQKARQDINALLQITSSELVNKLHGKLPITDHSTSSTSLERAKEILKTLRNGKTILIKDEGILFAGLNTKEILNALRTHLEVKK